MLKIYNIFKKLDEICFKKIDFYLETQFYKKFSDLFVDFSEKQQMIINKMINLVVIIAPLFLIIVFYIQNYSNRNHISIKKNIIKEIQKYYSLKRDIVVYNLKYLSSIPIETEDELIGLIDKAVTRLNLTQEQISVIDSKSILDHPIMKMTLSLTFNNLKSSDLFKFIKHLVKKFKIKISNIMIDQTSKNLLQGSFTLHYYGK